MAAKPATKHHASAVANPPVTLPVAPLLAQAIGHSFLAAMESHGCPFTERDLLGFQGWKGEAHYGDRADGIAAMITPTGEPFAGPVVSQSTGGKSRHVDPALLKVLMGSINEATGKKYTAAEALALIS